MSLLASHLLLLLLLLTLTFFPPCRCSTGSWTLLLTNSGVSAMHMTLSHTNKVVIFDRTDYGPSAISLPNGRCRNDSADQALQLDCWAHSVELDLSTMSIRALEVLTDPWCSSAAFLSDGTLLQTGGYNDGARVVRSYKFCDGCDWIEQVDGLSKSRWYASNQILPDDRIVVVGGRKEFNYEFVPGDGTVYSLPFLQETYDKGAENNLYPFLHLLPDGKLFVFANSDSVLLDYTSNSVLKRFPTLPGGARSYPASGSSVLLPLLASEKFQRAEVLICGGAAKTAYRMASSGVFMTALSSCGRMAVTDESPKWEMEDMPVGRVMGDMINLPTGEVLIINGCQLGSAGWKLGREPVLSPVLYKPSSSPGFRFTTLTPTTIPRMYHSSAILIPDGRVLVGGSNPNVGYDFSGVLFPTELRMEVFIPGYLDSTLDAQRPNSVSVDTREVVGYGVEFDVLFSVSVGLVDTDSGVDVYLYGGAFATHSYTMNQRMLKLELTKLVEQEGLYRLTVSSPESKTVAPAGYYMVFVVHSGVPGVGTWIQLR